MTRVKRRATLSSARRRASSPAISLHLGAGVLVELAVVPHGLQDLLPLRDLLRGVRLDRGPARVLGLLLRDELVRGLVPLRRLLERGEQFVIAREQRVALVDE